jgi:hypothetical protein
MPTPLAMSLGPLSSHIRRESPSKETLMIAPELDARFGNADAGPTPWAAVDAALAQAEIFWIATVRGDGRPHVTPLIAVWHDDSMIFTTGSEEQKAHNLAANPAVALTTGANALHEGLDIVVEGSAVRVTDPGRLQTLSDAYGAKYGEEWHFTVADGGFLGQAAGEPVYVFAVAPTKVLAFGKGEYSQTRFRPGSAR